ncbi:hypothetical protein [Cupriavidus necator]|uniref:hypothetical protein n=1 Tax=Cupriavidus necator TaxID=106590 RepID=UPI0012D2E527|nr:hypothetical protein [Cupriavidus necator]
MPLGVPNPEVGKPIHSVEVYISGTLTKGYHRSVSLKQQPQVDQRHAAAQARPAPRYGEDFLKIKPFLAGFEAKQTLRMTIAWCTLPGDNGSEERASPDGCARASCSRPEPSARPVSVERSNSVTPVAHNKFVSQRSTVAGEAWRLIAF